MAQLIDVWPVPGRTVLHPETRRPIDNPAGQRVPGTGDVLRAIRRGDLAKSNPKPATGKAAPTKPTATEG